MSFMLRSRVRERSFCAAAFCLAAFTGSNTSFASHLAIGAVEQVDLKTSSIVVLGQHYHIAASTLLTSQGSDTTHLALADVPQDALVLVDGDESASGATRVDTVILLSASNVPGASELFVTGVVGAVGSDGHMRIGQLKIDFTPTLTSATSPLAVGDFVEVHGIQPAAHGVFLAESIARTSGVGGTGRVSAAGVGGTGYSTLGVGGTGRVSAAGVGGTGYSTLGVGGTGRASTAGVGGTGYSALGVGGTGKVSAAGVGGTGYSTLGVGGTGRVSTAGVGGTGNSALSVGGTT